jgi:hypothetical protein
MRDILIFLGALSVAGCLENGGICTTSVEPAVEVEVRDAATGAPLTITPRGVAREGTYEDSLRIWSMTADVPQRVISLAGASERAGTYSIHVEAEGYRAWDTAGVRVTQDECHVRTARFTAEMNPGS